MRLWIPVGFSFLVPAAFAAALAGNAWLQDPAPAEVPSAADYAELINLSADDICRAPHVAAVYEQAKQSLATPAVQRDDELPIDIEIKDDLQLVDHHGQWRASGELFKGKLTMLFFGYASCDGICTIAIPTIAEASDILNADEQIAQPVLITIDPKRDKPAYMREQLGLFSDDFIGLTGPDALLKRARSMFNVQVDPLFENDDGMVFKHGSFIYLIDEHGEVVSLLPPVLPPEQIATIARKYI